MEKKTYTIILKEEETLNQWLDKQLKTKLIVESSSRYTALFQRRMKHYS